MKRIFFLATISLAIMYSCKSRPINEITASPGASVETVPDRDVIKQSDSTKLKTVDSISQIK